MLLNIVKMRYGEPPVFLDVASVINQYSLEGSVNAGANLNGGLTGKDVYSLGGNAKWADRPTITYQPLSGEKFTRALLTPVPPDRILWLVQSGFAADFVLRLATRSINGIRNHVEMSGIRHPADPEWGPLLTAILRLQQSNNVGVRLQSREGRPSVALFVQGEKLTESESADLAFFRETMGLDPDTNQYEVVYGVPMNHREIAIQTRSLIEMILELGSSIQVPISHIEDGRARHVPPLDDEQHYLISIQSGPDEPRDAFVKTRFDDHWFWIDKGAIYSKQTLTFMMFLSSVAETGTPVQAPVVTVSAGQ
jgi:hypothetical protein